MPTILGHTVVALAVGETYPRKMHTPGFIWLGIFCAILPDIDVMAFRFGVPYGSVWGHRGFTHSLLFAVILGALVTLIFYRKTIPSWKTLGYFSFFTICTALHGIFDAMTNGGSGVGFFIPWDNTRYFLPWRPIQVSPLNVKTFVEKGWPVLKSEFFWIVLPCSIYILILKKIRTRNSHR